MTDDRLAFEACDGVHLWKDLSRPIRRVTFRGVFPPLPYTRMDLTGLPYNRTGLTGPPDTGWGITVDDPIPDS